ncbi:hypothetical protein GCK72_011615 [Caenorhabditis remanei]|uniref:Tyrosine-protein phosphatase domain-containing protein n=1 Tax=Caenorhabditis remanei TaxID=31234 RepID=A0A6A5H8F6_CAERE|nr:hypothetical protein GCK72_011615 [Caenorhabditis remanei]KAF1763349.1 hypothetical protein GCK72_011615 [Caenorhabditis remanei]
MGIPVAICWCRRRKSPADEKNLEDVEKGDNTKQHKVSVKKNESYSSDEEPVKEVTKVAKEEKKKEKAKRKSIKSSKKEDEPELKVEKTQESWKSEKDQPAFKQFPVGVIRLYFLLAQLKRRTLLTHLKRFPFISVPNTVLFAMHMKDVFDGVTAEWYPHLTNSVIDLVRWFRYMNPWSGIDRLKLKKVIFPGGVLHANLITFVNKAKMVLLESPQNKRDNRNDTNGLFWQAVAQENPGYILDFADPDERRIEKCSVYFPTEKNDTMEYGDGKVKVKCMNVERERKYGLVNGEPEVTVTILHYTKWPRKGFPENVDTIVRMMEIISTTKQTVFVHCPDGAEKSGVIALIYEMRLRVSIGSGNLKVAECFSFIRNGRSNTVPTLDHLCFAFIAFVKWIEKDLQNSKTDPSTKDYNENTQASLKEFNEMFTEILKEKASVIIAKDAKQRENAKIKKIVKNGIKEHENAEIEDLKKKIDELNMICYEGSNYHQGWLARQKEIAEEDKRIKKLEETRLIEANQKLADQIAEDQRQAQMETHTAEEERVETKGSKSSRSSASSDLLNI